MHLISKWLLWHRFIVLNTMHTQESNALTKILQISGYMNDTIVISCLCYLLLGRTINLCTIGGMVGIKWPILDHRDKTLPCSQGVFRGEKPLRSVSIFSFCVSKFCLCNLTYSYFICCCKGMCVLNKLCNLKIRYSGFYGGMDWESCC